MNANGRNRVLFVCTQMEAGGVQVRATSMMQKLNEEGHESAVLFLYRKRPVFENEPKITWLWSEKPSKLSYLTIVWRLIRFVRRYKPTAIVGMAHYASPLACLVGLACGVRLRVATQTNPPSSLNPFARMLDWVCGSAGVYTANIAASHTTERCFDGYGNRYRSLLTTVQNGVQVSCTQLDRQFARSKFGFDSDAFLLVTCGRLSAQKNHAFLFSVLERLPDVRLAVLGEGELRNELEAEIASRGIANRVTLVGEIPPNRVGEFLSCGDVFVFPSKFEAFGLAVAEAMLVGLPIVASNHPAMCEVVGDAGCLLEISDPNAWVNEIERFRTSSERRRVAGERSRKRAGAFTVDAMLAGFKVKMLLGAES